MPNDAVRLEVENGVATITLNEPEKRNALSLAIKSGLADALDEVNERDDARVLVIEGEGPAFCAGGDISSMGDREGGQHDDVRRIVKGCEEVPIRLFNYEIPTVAKVEGYCVGAGMGVALACDVVLAAEDSGFGLVFRNIGLSVDYATSYFVPRLVGPKKAKELALTGEIVDGASAAEMGLVNHVYPDDEFDERADELIRTIADGPTVALHYSTKNIDRGFEGSIRDAVEREAESQSIVRGMDDHAEGIEAFSEGRDPEFRGR